jgi:hypothetical protein
LTQLPWKHARQVPHEVPSALAWQVPLAVHTWQMPQLAPTVTEHVPVLSQTRQVPQLAPSSPATQSPA